MDSNEENHMIRPARLSCNGPNKTEVNPKYILPPSERPRLAEVFSSSEGCIPTLDLTGLDGPQRPGLIAQIKQFCEVGVFQIINHGVSEELMENMMEVSKGFFKMPVEDHAELYIENPKATARLYTSSIVGKEKVRNWREILKLSCKYPLEQTINSWPPKPQAFRDIAAKYCTEVRALILRILAAISEALGLDPDYLSKCMGTHRQVMAVNYYPMCPNPELTFGIPPHSDPTVVTVLQQDDVSGLQVLKNRKWIAVEPIPNAFVVNVADQLEVISNGRFRSVEHRAVTNSTKARISIPTFYGPSTDAFIAPAKSLVIEECGHPALYRGFIFEEYLKKYTSQELKSKTVLDTFKINME